MFRLLEKIKSISKYLILLNIFLIAFILYQIFFSSYYWKDQGDKDFEIEPGKSLDEIAGSLKQNDIIPSIILFKIAVKLSGKENQLISNSYTFKNGMNNFEITEILTDKSLVKTVKFTIPEGYTIRQIANLAEKKLGLSKEKFIKEAANDSLINILGLKGRIKNLEGFLYPDTYEVSKNVSEKKLVMILFGEFRKKFFDNKNINSIIKENDSLLLNTVIMASIIQGETGIRSEMPVVAGVYYNRMKINMKLEADPTIQYIITDGPRRLLLSDLKINSPYNTYLNKGLPPGPVNNPGIDAVIAALNPDEHKYLFFVATGEGGHKFSENYTQHQQAVREYRQKLKNSKK